MLSLFNHCLLEAPAMHRHQGGCDVFKNWVISRSEKVQDDIGAQWKILVHLPCTGSSSIPRTDHHQPAHKAVRPLDWVYHSKCQDVSLDSQIKMKLYITIWSRNHLAARTIKSVFSLPEDIHKCKHTLTGHHCYKTGYYQPCPKEEKAKYENYYLHYSMNKFIC